MLIGLIFTFSYIVYFKFISPQLNTSEHWLFGISPEGIGFIGMLLNICCALGISKVTSPPPIEVQHLVDNIRIPTDAGTAHQH